MTLPLAINDTVLEHDGATVRLRPSLRAATLLQNKNGFGSIAHHIVAGKLSMVLAVAEATADDPEAARRLINQRVEENGAIALNDWIEPLCYLVADCFGIDPHAEHAVERDQPDPGEALDFGKALTDLYEIGTGWLGWSPADTWRATPAEIMAARDGLMAKLKAIHGSADEEDQSSHDPQAEVSHDEVQAGLAKLRANAMRGTR
jgi:hypothetical protein